MAFKMKGYSPFTQYDPVKKPVGPVTPSTKAEYGKRQVWNLVEQDKKEIADDHKKASEDFERADRLNKFQKKFDEKYNRANQKSPLKQSNDDDSKRMTDAEHKVHVDKVTEYNKKNWEENPLSPERKQNLIKKLTESSNNARKNIDKMYDLKRSHGNLSQSDSLKLEDLKREWSDHQTMLHNLRGKDASKNKKSSGFKDLGRAGFDKDKADEYKGRSTVVRYGPGTSGYKSKSPMKQGVIMDDRTKKAMMLFPLVSDSDSIAKQKHDIVKEVYNSDTNKMDSIVNHHLKNNPIYQKKK